MRSGGSWSLLGRRASLLLGCMLQYDVYAVCDGGVVRCNTAGARPTSRWALAEASLKRETHRASCLSVLPRHAKQKAPTPDCGTAVLYRKTLVDSAFLGARARRTGMTALCSCSSSSSCMRGANSYPPPHILRLVGVARAPQRPVCKNLFDSCGM